MLLSFCLLLLNPRALTDGYSYLCFQMRKLRLKCLSHLLVISLERGSARQPSPPRAVCVLSAVPERNSRAAPHSHPSPVPHPQLQSDFILGRTWWKTNTSLLRQRNVKARPSDWTTDFCRPFSGHLGPPLNLLTQIDAEVSPGNIPKWVKDPLCLWLPRLQWLPHRNLSTDTSGINDSRAHLALLWLYQKDPESRGAGVGKDSCPQIVKYHDNPLLQPRKREPRELLSKAHMKTGLCFLRAWNESGFFPLQQSSMEKELREEQRPRTQWGGP